MRRENFMGNVSVLYFLLQLSPAGPFSPLGRQIEIFRFPRSATVNKLPFNKTVLFISRG
jgi:hypothetical protein